MAERIDIEYQLTFDAAFHFGTGYRAGLIHRTVAQDSDGYLYVPGSTLKGVLRDRCEQLARLFELTAHDPHSEDDSLVAFGERTGIVGQIFGSNYHAGQVYFDDALMTRDSRALFVGVGDINYQERQVETRTQVSMSRLTQTAKAGHLYTSEYGIRELTFTGKIYGYLTDYPLAEIAGTYSLLLLVAGLASLDRLGSGKSSGAGQCNITITSLKVDDNALDYKELLKRLEDIEYYEIAQEEALA